MIKLNWILNIDKPKCKRIKSKILLKMKTKRQKTVIQKLYLLSDMTKCKQSQRKKKKALFSQLTFHFFNWINFSSRSFSSFFWMSVCFAFSCASHFSSGEFSFCFFSYQKKNFRKNVKAWAVEWEESTL